jgi:hypothetical protein
MQPWQHWCTGRSSGQARAIVIDRPTMDEVKAFHVLNRASERSNRKFIIIAEDFTLTGQLRTT